jgi:uncharacterized protein with LGFP repeats
MMFFRKRSHYEGESESKKKMQVPDERKEYVTENKDDRKSSIVEVSHEDVKTPQETVASAEEQKLIDNQQQREEVASARGAFVENQRVRYFFKANDTWYDATIVGVHYDDGPDRPYYTIRFWRNGVEYDENHMESVVRQVVEKQTTPERLERVAFDPELTWKILTEAV